MTEAADGGVDEADPIGGRRLVPGDIAPDFVLPDADGDPVALSTFRGSKTVLYFYPAASTPGCTTQAVDFRDALPDLQRAGYTVIGISPDELPALQRFRDEHQLSFPLLSDPGRSVLTAYGAWGEKTLYGRRSVGVIRSTIVVDERAEVLAAYYNVKAKGHVEKLRRDIGGSAPTVR